MKNQTLSFSLAAVLVAGATFAAAGASAVADPAPQEFEFRFAYAPSELDDETAASRMLTRLHYEVRKHCATDARQLNNRATQMCVEQTMSRVVNQIGSSTLASAHSQRMG